MRIVQYESGGVTGCGVSVGDDVFATGYGERGMVPSAFSDVPILRKPYDAESLAEAIASMMGRRS